MTDRWNKEEIFGSAYVDGADLYTAYDSSPEVYSDPSGYKPTTSVVAGGTTEKLKEGGAMTLPDGEAATVSVITAGDLTDGKDKVPGYIGIKVEINRNSGRPACAKCKWVQFITETSPSNAKWIGLKDGKWPWRETGVIYLDTQDDTNVAYGGLTNRPDSGQSILMIDGPYAEEVGTKFTVDDYLLCDDGQGKQKVTYHVHWTSTTQADFSMKYGDVSGDPADDMGDLGKQKQWIIGGSTPHDNNDDPNDGKTKTSPHYVKNPLL